MPSNSLSRRKALMKVRTKLHADFWSDVTRRTRFSSLFPIMHLLGKSNNRFSDERNGGGRNAAFGSCCQYVCRHLFQKNKVKKGGISVDKNKSRKNWPDELLLCLNIKPGSCCRSAKTQERRAKTRLVGHPTPDDGITRAPTSAR